MLTLPFLVGFQDIGCLSLWSCMCTPERHDTFLNVWALRHAEGAVSTLDVDSCQMYLVRVGYCKFTFVPLSQHGIINTIQGE